MQAAGARYIYHGSRTDSFRIWALADFHLGNAGCHEKLLTQHVEEIRTDPFSYWVGVGDYADYIGYRDRRFDPECIKSDMLISDLGRLGQVLTARVAETLDPIRDKCLGLAFGNHEARYMKEAEQQGLHAWLCTELGVPNLGYSFLMDVSFLRKNVPSKFGKVYAAAPDARNTTSTFRLYGHHGAGASATPSGKTRRLQLFMEQHIADAYVIGHVHGKHTLTLTQVGGNRACNELQDFNRMGIITGSYLKTYNEGTAAGYGEKAGYSPAPLGAAVIGYAPDKRELSVRTTARLGDAR